QIEEGPFAALVGDEFIAVDVVEEFQSALREFLAGPIEYVDGVEAVLPFERRFDPRHADILDPENFRILDHLVDAVTRSLILDVHADGLESRLVELGAELPRRHTVVAGQLDVGEPELVHPLQSPRNVLLEIVTKAPELNGKRFVERFADAEPRAGGCSRSNQRGRRE